MKIKILALVISAVFVTACSDNGGSSTISPQKSLEVKAIDGYLSGAEVWLDVTPNYLWDEGEPKAESGDGGLASLDVSEVDDYEKYPVVVKAIKGKTVDLDKPNKPISFDFIMTAPAGETNITPLTTLIKLDMDTTGASKENALQDVSEKLGVPKETLLSDYTLDPKTSNKAKNIVDCGLMPETESEAKEIFESDNFFVDSAELNDVSEVVKELESNQTIITDGSNFSAVEDDGSGDMDGDGFLDEEDALPLNSSEWIDTDGDGTGNNADTDDDNDTVNDDQDDFPLDPTETTDTDGDGTGNNADTDDDNDAVNDDQDDFPLDPTEATDTDGDGTGNNADTDDDNDAVNDDQDDFPLDPTEATDTDDDGTGNNADTDDDGDGVNDDQDDFPLDPTETTDTDGDGTGNNADIDDDGDGLSDLDDNCPNDANASQLDYDNDGVGDACDSERLATFDEATFDSDKWL